MVLFLGVVWQVFIEYQALLRGLRYNLLMPDSIQENVLLRDYSTMRLGGPARFLLEVHAEEELTNAITWARQNNIATIVIGSGSNIVWQDGGFEGLVIVNKLHGITLTGPVKDAYTIEVGAGEIWDDVVAFAVDHNLSGIETLSLIPGTAGAAPVQNIGAYGAEASTTIAWVEAITIATGKLVRFSNDACDFSYRHSRFNTTDKGKYAITKVGFTLKNSSKLKNGHAISLPFYKDVALYLEEHNITKPRPGAIRDAVIAIRQAKLPDPARMANNGSFFKNPIISAEQFELLVKEYPTMPHWQTDDGRFKLAGGWLIEQAGFKGYKDKQTGMAVWPRQALVIVNVVARHTIDLLSFRNKIIAGVHAKFGITLEQEPELLGKPHNLGAPHHG